MVVLFLTHLKMVDITSSNEELFCTDVFKVERSIKDRINWPLCIYGDVTILT